MSDFRPAEVRLKVRPHLRGLFGDHPSSFSDDLAVERFCRESLWQRPQQGRQRLDSPQ